MKNKLVFIGNSIVNGFPMSRGRSFPGLIRASLKEGIAIERDAGGHAECGDGSERERSRREKTVTLYADVINKGANGETTAQILDRFEHDVIAHQPAAVFIMTGTNDFIYREADPAGCMANLKTMVRMCDDTGIRPVLMTPLPVHAGKASRMWMAGVGIDYEQINEEIEEFSEMIRESGQLCVDSGTLWKRFMDGGSKTGEQAGLDLPLPGGIEYPQRSEDSYIDGVHPTPEGYRFLAEIVLAWIGRNAEELGLNF